MNYRPLLQKGIFELERMFSESQTNLIALKSLKFELQHRKASRALALLEKVEAALEECKQLSRKVPMSIQEIGFLASDTEGPNQSGDTEIANKPEEITKSAEPFNSTTVTQTATAVQNRASQSERPKNSLQPLTPVSLTLEQAYRVLGVTSSSSWEMIEQTRRALVEKARPDLVADLKEEQRIKIQTEARRVNQAYEMLARARIRSDGLVFK